MSVDASDRCRELSGVWRMTIALHCGLQMHPVPRTVKKRIPMNPAWCLKLWWLSGTETDPNTAVRLLGLDGLWRAGL